MAVVERIGAGASIAALGSFLAAASGCGNPLRESGPSQTPKTVSVGPHSLLCPRSPASVPQGCPRLPSRTAEETELDAAAWVVRKDAFAQERLAANWRRGAARRALELERDRAGQKGADNAPGPEMSEAEREESVRLDARAEEIAERERCGGKPAGRAVVLVPLSEAQPVVKLVHAAIVAPDGNGPGESESVVARVGCEWRAVNLADAGSFETAFRTPSGEWVFTGIVKHDQCSSTFKVSRLHEERSEVLFAEESDGGPEGVCTPRARLEWEVEGGVLFGVRRLVRDPERGDYSLAARYRWSRGTLVYGLADQAPHGR